MLIKFFIAVILIYKHFSMIVIIIASLPFIINPIQLLAVQSLHPIEGTTWCVCMKAHEQHFQEENKHAMFMKWKHRQWRPLLWDNVCKKRSSYSNRTVNSRYSNRAVTVFREAV